MLSPGCKGCGSHRKSKVKVKTHMKLLVEAEVNEGSGKPRFNALHNMKVWRRRAARNAIRTLR